MLREEGYRLATLTNSVGLAGESELRFAGLRDFFEQALAFEKGDALFDVRHRFVFSFGYELPRLSEAAIRLRVSCCEAQAQSPLQALGQRAAVTAALATGEHQVGRA